MDILLPLLTISDEYFAEIRRRKGCSFCGGTLHAAHYYRGTRGPGIHCELLRFSYCCSRQGCRKRHTPPSVRFLGPKVYLGLVIILISAAHLLLDPKDANGVRERFGIDRRTVGRWRNWWIFGFIATFFWKDARARFVPRLDHGALPVSLCSAFTIQFENFATQSPLYLEPLARLMEFLRPLFDP